MGGGVDAATEQTGLQARPSALGLWFPKFEVCGEERSSWRSSPLGVCSFFMPIRIYERCLGIRAISPLAPFGDDAETAPEGKSRSAALGPTQATATRSLSLSSRQHPPCLPGGLH